MKACPQCHHKPNNDELALYPEYCAKCGTLYSALEAINEKKRKENESLKAWRVTRWRAKNGRGLFFGVPAFMVILFVIYHIGQHVIANSRPISNILYQSLKNEDSSTYSSTKQHNSNKTENQQNKTTIKTENNKALITLITRSDTTIWLVDEKSGKNFGPIKVSKGEIKFYLDKSKYIVKILKNNRISLKNFTVDKAEYIIEL